MRSLGFLAMQAVIGLVVISWNPPDAQDYLRVHGDKMQHLRKAQDPRIIFVGGSNLAFGIDSQRIGQALNRTPVNMALHAGLGMDLELAAVLPHLREGDVTLISLEHPAFNAFVAGPELWQLLRIDPGIITLLSLRQWKSMADLGLIYLAGQVRALRRLDRKASPFYLRSAFDSFGDAVAHRSETTRPPLPSISLAGISSRRISATISRLNTFHSACQEKGARVFYSFPAINEANHERLRPQLAEIEEALRLHLQFKLLDTTAEMSYSQSDFFDTAYHLNGTGIARRSEHLITVLRAALR